MTKTGLPKLIAITLLSGYLAAPAVAQDQESNMPAILEVMGEGRETVTPDLATIRMGVVAEAPEPQAAVTAMEEPLSALLAELDGLEIDPGDVQTGELRLNPIYANEGPEPGAAPRITGYEAASDVEVLVRDLERLGVVLGAAIDAGSNRFNGLSFGIADPAPVADAALGSAVEDAMRKARILAEAAGRTLGPIVHMREMEGAGDPGPVMMRAAMEGAVPVAPGSLETVKRVAVRYELAE
ncbi:SIMPL domain-containing protein [Palleronia sp. LCG004]|uniref:SIMPL domain-containing protein n=1 Tax=Palleronia sp. LCG004 TaxID=3079304 RepID=UPI002941C8FD|nr:SIMPL domain-containing protein [Palleronia sp. LCG004]WOI57281.1 SIMPL domain-containing protein [Palleronia sp. LCG004]